jgi:type II secretory pathway pseudopilin PulG
MSLVRRAATRDGGYAMVALLVGMAVAGVLLSVAMQSWRSVVKREKEEELVFRGQQYARAIGLFQRKFANAFPPTIDVLVEQKFLRKKYRDPMAPREDTKGEFQVLYQNTTQMRAGQMSGGLAQSGAGQSDPRRQGALGTPLQGGSAAGQPGRSLGGSAGLGPGGPAGGVVGVASKSKEKSLRVYNGAKNYAEWQFIWIAATTTPGGRGMQRPGMQPGAGGRGQMGGRGGRGEGAGAMGTGRSAFDPRRAP